MFAHKLAVVRLVGLVFAVKRHLHYAAQKTFLVAGKQGIPVSTPHQLDDIPAAAAEVAFKFLNDLAVTAHRTVKALQIAVHDKNEIVEFLPRGTADGAQGFGLVHFAVAAEYPHFTFAGFLTPACTPDESRVGKE